MSVTRWRWFGLSAAGLLTAVALTGSLVVSGAGTADETVFVPVVPCRLVDTRPGIDNVGPRSTAIGENSPVMFTAWGSGDDDSACNVPSSATAISTNTTTLHATSYSFVTLYPGDATLPDTSNLNLAPGQPPTPNAVTTPLSATGQFNVFNRFGTVDVIVDINGYFQPSTNVGATGPQGPAGPKGDTGATGPVNTADFENRYSPLIVPGAAWQADGQSSDYFFSFGLGSYNYAGSSTNCQMAPLELPHGATIDLVTAYFYDNNVDWNGYVNVLRVELASSAPSETLGTVTSAGASTEFQAFTDATIANAIIDRGYAYYLTSCFPGPEIGIRGVAIYLSPG